MAARSEWPTIAEAAAALQTSSRSIERRIKAGEIEAQPRPRPGRKPETVCNPADIERLSPPAFVMPAANSSNAALVTTAEKFPVASPLDWIAAIAGTLAKPAHPRVWLPLDEAAEVSGLSAALLKREAKAGTIVAVRDGRKWKFQREALLHWTPGISQSPKTSTAESPSSSASTR